MDPAITMLLVTSLGQGLVKALEMLADKGESGQSAHPRAESELSHGAPGINPCYG